MYSYLHRYHAGNFADVHKHLVLVAILDKLKEKPTPFAVLDAFAGEGIYSLNSEAALKNVEHAQGVVKLWASDAVLPSLAQKYRDCIASYQSNLELSLYPGSPAFIASQLRSQDRGIFVEGHPACFSVLKQHFFKNKNVHLHQRDAYEALNALVPFKEKRGLIFLDPSYEVKQEYERLAHQTLDVLRQFPNGIYCIWYPILAGNYHEKLKKIFQGQSDLKQYHHEFYPAHDPKHGLLGSGVWIINPPWQLENQLTETFGLLPL